MTSRRFVKASLLAPLMAAGVMVGVVVGPATRVLAATHTISDSASCTTFLSAIGATGSAVGSICYVTVGTIPVGDTVVVENGMTLRPQQPGGGLTNNGTITVRSGGQLYVAGTLTNSGTITVQSGATLSSYYLSSNSGSITVAGAAVAHFYYSTFTNSGAFTNNGSVNLATTFANSGSYANNGGTTIVASTVCGIFTNTGSFTGSAVADVCRPMVTVEQAAGQTDPATYTPLLFTVTFSTSVTGFGTDDLQLFTSGTVSPSVQSITGGPSVYTVKVAVASGTGTVSLTVLADHASDTNGNTNLASTSVDNTVSVDGPLSLAPTEPTEPTTSDTSAVDDLAPTGGGGTALSALLLLMGGAVLVLASRRRTTASVRSR